MKPKLPHGKPRLIFCWEVNNFAVLQSPGTNFNVIFETTVTILMLRRKNHNYGNDMTLQFSHRRHIGCCISKGKVARYDLVLLRDFCDIVFYLVD